MTDNKYAPISSSSANILITILINVYIIITTYKMVLYKKHVSWNVLFQFLQKVRDWAMCQTWLIRWVQWCQECIVQLFCKGLVATIPDKVTHNWHAGNRAQTLYVSNSAINIVYRISHGNKCMYIPHFQNNQVSEHMVQRGTRQSSAPTPSLQHKT